MTSPQVMPLQVKPARTPSFLRPPALHGVVRAGLLVVLAAGLYLLAVQPAWTQYSQHWTRLLTLRQEQNLYLKTLQALERKSGQVLGVYDAVTAERHRLALGNILPEFVATVGALADSHGVVVRAMKPAPGNMAAAAAWPSAAGLFGAGPGHSGETGAGTAAGTAVGTATGTAAKGAASGPGRTGAPLPPEYSAMPVTLELQGTWPAVLSMLLALARSGQPVSWDKLSVKALDEATPGGGAGAGGGPETGSPETGSPGAGSPGVGGSSGAVEGREGAGLPAGTGGHPGWVDVQLDLRLLVYGATRGLQP